MATFQETLTRRCRRFAAVTLAGGMLLLLLSGSLPSSGVLVDRERGEVHIPCHFVNPTRVLEVFGCHDSGPTHETVVSFVATGPEIQAALLAIGCRPASYWNAFSPRDFAKNQGDRILVSVRWKRGETLVDVSAEGMLLDVHDDDVGLPAYLRGFSFAGKVRTREGTSQAPDAGTAPPDAGTAPPDAGSGAPDAGSGAPERRVPVIPEAVEITLGATKRESPSHPILTHPTNSTRLASWGLTPALDKTMVPDLEELVRAQTPATLVLKRVHSEIEFIARARERAQRREWADRLRLLDALEPIAREIDALKDDYEQRESELRALLELLEQPQDGSDAHGLKQQESLVVKALRGGQWLCARIEERYLAMYAQQEAHKLTWLEAHADLPFEVRDEARVYATYGAPVEHEVARKEVALARLRVVSGDSLRSTEDADAKTLAAEIEDIESRRKVGLAEANLEYYRYRLKNVDNEYQREIFSEDVMKAEAAVLLEVAKQAEQSTVTQECRYRQRGVWHLKAQDVKQSRVAAVRTRQLAELGVSRVELLQRIRWSRHDVEDTDPVRSARARTEIERLKKELEELETGRAQLESAPLGVDPTADP